MEESVNVLTCQGVHLFITAERGEVEPLGVNKNNMAVKLLFKDIFKPVSFFCRSLKVKTYVEFRRN